MSEFEPDEDNTDHVGLLGNSGVIDADVWKSLINGMSAVDHQLAATIADTRQDTLLELRNCVLVIQQRAAAMRERIDHKFVEAIRAHGPIEAGTIRYIVSVDRTTRCTDVKAVADSLLDATRGDLNRFCEQLVSQPFKAASVRAVISTEKYQGCFEVVERNSVEGKPIEKLAKVDERFVRRRGERDNGE